MDKINLTPEQMAQYMAIVDEVEKLRSLSDAEKEKLIRNIMEKPFLDLLCDVAFKYVFQQDMDSLLMLLNDFLPFSEDIPDLLKVFFAFLHFDFLVKIVGWGWSFMRFVKRWFQFVHFICKTFNFLPDLFRLG